MTKLGKRVSCVAIPLFSEAPCTSTETMDCRVLVLSAAETNQTRRKPMKSYQVTELGEPLELEEESDTEMAAEELQEYLRKLAPEDFGRFTP